MRLTLPLHISSCVVVLLSSVPLEAQPPSVWDGVYTAEQAARGAPLYVGECAECHGEDLAGLDMAPALVGEEFLYNWDGLPLGDLFERLRVSMPQADPASVSRQDKADILAYMLEAAGYPPGDEELPRRARAMRDLLLLVLQP